MPDPVPESAKGVDVPERITRAIIAAKERFAAENPDKPHGFTIRKAIDAARAQWRLERPGKVGGRDLIFDAIVRACGGDLDQLTPSYSAQVAKAKKEICSASPEVTPDEILRRAARYRSVFPKIGAPSPLALAKHWPEFPLPPKRPDVNDEPQLWQATLLRLCESKKWDMVTAKLMSQMRWVDVPITVRQEIVKALL